MSVLDKKTTASWGLGHVGGVGDPDFGAKPASPLRAPPTNKALEDEICGAGCLGPQLDGQGASLGRSGTTGGCSARFQTR